MGIIRKIIISLAGLLMIACAPSLPSDILSEGKMEDVLYDVHLAHYIPEKGKDNIEWDAVTQHARLLEILKKHGITEKEWTHSMEYYTRHTELLTDVYKNLYERMSGEAEDMGIATDMGGDMSSIENDSTDIWQGVKQLAITSEPPYTVQTWSQEIKDSIVGKGEKITLSFKSMQVSTESYGRGTAVMAVVLDNDSVIQSTTTIGSMGTNNTSVSCPEGHGVKKIKGMFIMQRSSSSSSSVKENGQTMLITDIHLLHNPINRPKREEQEINSESKEQTVSSDSTTKETDRKPSQKLTLPEGRPIGRLERRKLQ